MAIVEMQASVAGGQGVSMDGLRLNTLLFGILHTANEEWVIITQEADFDQFRGQFVIDYDFNRIVGGVLTDFRELWADGRNIHILNFSAPAHTVTDLLLSGQAQAALGLILAGNDSIGGTTGADLLRGYGGDDQIGGSGGDDAIFGGPGNDSIGGSGGADILWGEAGDDRIGGDFHDDILIGGAGSDSMSGGDGIDAARFSGSLLAYSWGEVQPGVWAVADNRPGSPDGTDFLTQFETLQFADGKISLVAAPAGPAATAYQNILRASTAAGGRGAAPASDLAADVGSGAKTLAEAIEAMVDAADATSSVATLAYQFFTGKVPSLGGMDYLVSPEGPNPNNINSAYYQAFNLENRYINFAVNLGKLGEGRAAFETAYGNKTLFEATTLAYAVIFGATPTDAKVAALVPQARADYFAAYGGDGLTGIGTKAAMVGWLLAEAAKADVGMYARANDAFLTDAADGADFLIDLVGVYGRPEYAFGG